MSGHLLNDRTWSFEDKKKILYKAHELCYKCRVDVLDCSKSIARQRTDKSFEWVMEKFTPECHFTVIHRSYMEDYLEVGFCEMQAGPNYFLFLEVKSDYIGEITGDHEYYPLFLLQEEYPEFIHLLDDNDSQEFIAAIERENPKHDLLEKLYNV